MSSSSSSAAAAAEEPAGAVKQQLLRQHAQLIDGARSLQQALVACLPVPTPAAALAAADAGLADQQQDEHPQVPPALVEAADKLAVDLRAFGLAVAVQVPAAVLCCNPACINLQGSSEAALLGPGSRCSGCKVARFCSKECSMAAWKAGHKAVCKRLKAAGAADVET
jgi:hypothetical protein